MPAMSARACATVTPGLSRPIPQRIALARSETMNCWSSFGAAPSGIQASTGGRLSCSARASRKLSGATPTTVRGVWLSTTVLPTMSGAPAN